jgi:hypothetical protein
MLGTFGDSYTDPNSPSGDTPWMNLLASKLNLPVENHGRSGTSVWYSYEKFIKHYKKYSHIVFTYSHYDRINYLPEKFAGWHFMKPKDKFLSTNKEFKAQEFLMQQVVHHHYRYLHSTDLQLFIYQKVYEDVQKLCTENNIQVIHNFAFEPCRWEKNMNITLHTTRNVLSSDNISVEEVNAFQPGKTHTEEIGVPDRRVCHMTQKNNAILADIMHELFDSKEKTVLLDKSMFNFNLDELQRLFYK